MTESLSRWWADSHHRALGTTTDKTARLAIALGAVRSIIRVVDRTTPALTVDWAQVDEGGRSMSFTDIRGGHIFINPKPILDGRLNHGRALDAEVGFAMHEASHSQESRSRFEHLLKKEEFYPEGRITPVEREVFAFEPMRIALYLWNVVEDVRIEAATSKHWPGFAPYFDAVLDYMWGEMRATHELPEAYGPTIEEKLRVVFLACRYPTRVPSDYGGEVGWWQAWQADYLSDRATVAETIQRALDHLAEDPATAAEMAEMVEEERKERERGEKVRAQLERLLKEGIPGTYEFCITDEGEVIPLDAKTAEEVRRLVAENLIEHKTIVRAHGAANPPIHVRKPTETAASKRAYVGRPNAESDALRTALVFRASAPEYDEKLLKSGEIDDEELYRAGFGDNRVFSQHVIESKPDVFMGLLVDLSGSMGGSKLTIAQRLAQLFVWAIHDQEGVKTAVWGHTADVGHESTAEVYRIWEPGDPLSRLGLIATMEHMDNADGHAISYVVRQIENAEQPQKVLFVLADGLPQASGYGGPPATNHIRSVVRWAASRGVAVIQIAIDPYGIRPSEQSAMFGEGGWVGFHDYATLPRQLTQLMGRYL